MIFENINSKMPPSVRAMERILLSKDWFQPVLQSVPVFWVDERLMDQLYDPWRLVLLNPDCVNKKIEEEPRRERPDADRVDLDSLIKEVSDFWDSLEECREARLKYCPVSGVYFDSFPEEKRKLIARARGRSLAKSPVPAFHQSISSRPSPCNEQ